MEKFSAFRDPGTGIQPFLTPVAPVGADVLAKTISPIGFALGLVRTAMLLVVALCYVVLVQGACLVVAPIPPLYRITRHTLTALLARVALFLLGAFWIPVELVSRKRGRAAKTNELWKPGAGDIIISNWASWIEILYLAFRYDPIFVLPIPISVPASEVTPSQSPIATGRRTGTGSAAVAPSTTRALSAKIPFAGFKRVSLLGALGATGHVPPYSSAKIGSSTDSLEAVAKNTTRPIVVFAEGTTSNGRGLLRFAEIFQGKQLGSKTRLFLMCIRYDPPTALAPTPTYPIPASVLSPLPHAFALSRSLAPIQISVRLLPPSESPNTPGVVISEIIPPHRVGEPGAVEEACATLIAGLGKMKRVGAGWEDKVAFLEFYGSKRR